MRGSIVFAIIALCLGSLWYQASPEGHQEMIGLRADGSPLFESVLTAPETLASSAAGRRPADEAAIRMYTEHRDGHRHRY